MKPRILMYSAMFFLLLALTVTGCAKKTAQPGEEISAPKAAPAAPSMETKPSEPALSQAAVPSAAGALAAFDKKIYFDFDKFDLTPESIGTLNELAAFMKANTDLKVKIEGNCDERGTIEYNLALGERRAKSALDYLSSQGIDQQRLSATSYGKEKPADPGHNEEAWAKNRRDEFSLSK